jgi:hypothetical protein
MAFFYYFRLRIFDFGLPLPEDSLPERVEGRIKRMNFLFLNQ